MPSLQSSRKDFFASGGRSREFVHPLIGPGMGRTKPSRRRGFWAARLALPESLYRAGRFIVFSKTLKAVLWGLLARPSSTWRLRSFRRRSCSGMPTGHASEHAPQREEACGRSLASSFPLGGGVRAGPVGRERGRPGGVTAGLAVDGADVQTGPAADAVEG